MIYTEADGFKSKIKEYFSEEQIKALYYNALRVDLESENNNGKAEFVKAIIGEGFQKLGPGTNRAAFMKDGYVFKFALDKEGMVDNYTEFKRGPEQPDYLASPYETNHLILVCEYVTVIDEEEFMMNIDNIKQVLEILAEDYIFDDMGTITKNYQNWGYRTRGGEQTLVCLDYGYMYHKFGNEDALICPKCGKKLEYTSNYAQFICSSNVCNTKYNIRDIRRRMNRKFEEEEEAAIGSIMDYKLPRKKQTMA